MIDTDCLSIGIVKSSNKDGNIDLYTKKHYTGVSWPPIENTGITLFLEIMPAHEPAKPARTWLRSADSLTTS